MWFLVCRANSRNRQQFGLLLPLLRREEPTILLKTMTKTIAFVPIGGQAAKARLWARRAALGPGVVARRRVPFAATRARGDGGWQLATGCRRLSDEAATAPPTGSMALSLSTPTILLRSTAKVVGVSAGANPDEVFVTLHAQGVSLYDARTQACLRSWRTQAGVQLTHAACLHPGAGRLLGVRDHTTLFSWPEGAAEIDFRATQSLASPALCILHSPALLDAVAVVLVDGSVVIFDAASVQESGFFFTVK